MNLLNKILKKIYKTLESSQNVFNLKKATKKSAENSFFDEPIEEAPDINNIQVPQDNPVQYNQSVGVENVRQAPVEEYGTLEQSIANTKDGYLLTEEEFDTISQGVINENRSILRDLPRLAGEYNKAMSHWDESRSEEVNNAFKAKLLQFAIPEVTMDPRLYFDMDINPDRKERFGYLVKQNLGITDPKIIDDFINIISSHMTASVMDPDEEMVRWRNRVNNLINDMRNRLKSNRRNNSPVDVPDDSEESVVEKREWGNLTSGVYNLIMGLPSAKKQFIAPKFRDAEERDQMIIQAIMNRFGAPFENALDQRINFIVSLIGDEEKDIITPILEKDPSLKQMLDSFVENKQKKLYDQYINSNPSKKISYSLFKSFEDSVDALLKFKENPHKYAAFKKSMFNYMKYAMGDLLINSLIHAIQDPSNLNEVLAWIKRDPSLAYNTEGSSEMTTLNQQMGEDENEMVDFVTNKGYADATADSSDVIFQEMGEEKVFGIVNALVQDEVSQMEQIKRLTTENKMQEIISGIKEGKIDIRSGLKQFNTLEKINAYIGVALQDIRNILSQKPEINWGAKGKEIVIGRSKGTNKGGGREYLLRLNADQMAELLKTDDKRDTRMRGFKNPQEYVQSYRQRLESNQVSNIIEPQWDRAVGVEAVKNGVEKLASLKQAIKKAADELRVSGESINDAQYRGIREKIARYGKDYINLLLQYSNVNQSDQMTERERKINDFIYITILQENLNYNTKKQGYKDIAHHALGLLYPLVQENDKSTGRPLFSTDAIRAFTDLLNISTRVKDYKGFIDDSERAGRSKNMFYPEMINTDLYYAVRREDLPEHVQRIKNKEQLKENLSKNMGPNVSEQMKDKNEDYLRKKFHDIPKMEAEIPALEEKINSYRGAISSEVNKYQRMALNSINSKNKRGNTKKIMDDYINNPHMFNEHLNNLKQEQLREFYSKKFEEDLQEITLAKLVAYYNSNADYSKVKKDDKLNYADDADFSLSNFLYPYFIGVKKALLPYKNLFYEIEKMSNDLSTLRSNLPLIQQQVSEYEKNMNITASHEGIMRYAYAMYCQKVNELNHLIKLKSTFCKFASIGESFIESIDKDISNTKEYYDNIISMIFDSIGR